MSTFDRFAPCAVIPSYRHFRELPRIVETVRHHGLPVFIVDDGNSGEARNAIAALASASVVILRHENNCGKGASLHTGFRAALDAGFTHGMQIDADGQHNLDDIPHFLREGAADPRACILGAPTFDDSAPKIRVWGRKLSVLLVWLETGTTHIRDPLCGFRLYPLARTLRILNSRSVGLRMDFDPDIAVRLAWEGVPIRSVPTLVIYPPEGVSNFHYLKDNVSMVRLHSRLMFNALFNRGLAP